MVTSIYFLSISVHFQLCGISMVLQSDTMAMCSNPGEQVAVETLLSMRNSMCIGSGDESSVMSEDESRCTPSPTSSFQSSDEDSMSNSAEPSIFNRNSKLARVSFQSPMTHVLQQTKTCLCIKLLEIDFYLIFNANFVALTGRPNQFLLQTHEEKPGSAIRVCA